VRKYQLDADDASAGTGNPFYVRTNEWLKDVIRTVTDTLPSYSARMDPELRSAPSRRARG